MQDSIKHTNYVLELGKKHVGVFSHDFQKERHSITELKVL